MWPRKRRGREKLPELEVLHAGVGGVSEAEHLEVKSRL